MITALIASALLSQDKPLTDLSRVFTKGRTVNYAVRSHVYSDTTQYNWASPIPSELDINYDFTVKTTEVKPTGFASMLYDRPFVTEITGETAEHPPIVKKEPIKMKYQLSVSPINEVTDAKEVGKVTHPISAKFESRVARALGEAGLDRKVQLSISQFTGELYRLALFVGSMDSSLDFSPKLPFEEVKVGETWKKTISYQPQELKGKDGEHAVTRVDLTYKYEGIIDNVHRITATANIDTDVAKFINQLVQGGEASTGIEAFPLKLQTNISFDLDLKTRETISGSANTVGSWKLEVATLNVPFVEEKLKGRASIKRVSVK